MVEDRATRQKEIIGALRSNGEKMSLKALDEATSVGYDNLKQAASDMTKSGLLVRVERGVYDLPGRTTEGDHAGRLKRYQQTHTVEFFDPEFMKVAASNGGIVPFNEWRRIGVDLPTLLLRKLIGTPLPSVIHAWEIDGDSMKPEISPGDIIFTTPAKEIYDAGRYLVSMDGGLMLKKVQRLGGGVLRIIPENPDYYVEDLKPVEQGWLSLETDLIVDFYVRGRFLAVLRPYELDDPVMHGMNKLVRILADEGVISRKR